MPNFAVRMRAAASQRSLSFHGWASFTKAGQEGAQPPGTALLDPGPSTCCRRCSAVETHLIIHPTECAGSPRMIHCCNALVGNRMEQVQEERGSLIWVGAAQPHLVQQWVLHLTLSCVCFITSIDLQTINISVSQAHAQADWFAVLKQSHRKFETLSRDVASTKHRRTKSCGRMYPGKQLYDCKFDYIC